MTDGRYELSERQANAILELRLYQLTGLERDKIIAEYTELLMVTIRDLMDILANEHRVLSIIKEEVLAIKSAKYATPRLTQIVPDEGEINIEDLIANEGEIITITHGGFIKRTPVSEYRAQARGGKGVIGMTTRDDAGGDEDKGDFVEHLFTASTHDFLMFFTKTGRCYVDQGATNCPMGSRTFQGPEHRQLPGTAPGRKDRRDHPRPASHRAHRRGSGGHDVDRPDAARPFRHAGASVKKTELAPISATCRKGGIIAINIEDGDELIEAEADQRQRRASCSSRARA